MIEYRSAYVNGKEYDVFFSYASVDNVNATSRRPGWVSNFFSEVKVAVDQLLGGRDIARLYIDLGELNKDRSWQKQLDIVLDRTAVFIMVVSTGYIASEACRNEIAHFKKLVESETSAKIWDSGRLVIVRIAPLSREEDDWLKEYSGPKHEDLGHQFFVNESGQPTPKKLEPKDDAYKSQVMAIASSIAARLKAMKLVSERATTPKKPLSCIPDDKAACWRWQLVDSTYPYLLGWSESGICLWDVMQTTNPDHIAEKLVIATYEDLEQYVNPFLIAVCNRKTEEDGRLQIYAITNRSEIVVTNLDMRSKTRTFDSEKQSIALSSILQENKMKLIDGVFGNDCVVAIYETRCDDDAEGLSHTYWLALAVKKAHGWEWDSNLPLVQLLGRSAVRFDAQGNFLLVVTSSLQFQLFSPTSEHFGIPLVTGSMDCDLTDDDEFHVGCSGNALSDFELELLTSPQESNSDICWYGSTSGGTVFCVSFDAKLVELNISKLQTHRNNKIAARYVDRNPQLMIADVYRDVSSSSSVNRRWNLCVWLWFPGTVEPESWVLDTPQQRPEIVSVSYDETTDRILVLWNSGDGKSTFFNSLLPSNPDSKEALPDHRILKAIIPKNSEVVNSSRGLAAVCSVNFLMLFETQGFETIAYQSLIKVPAQVPFRWFQVGDQKLRLITTSTKLACVWEMPTQFDCRALPIDIPSGKFVRLTQSGYVVYGRLSPAQIVIETLSGRRTKVIDIPEQYIEQFADLRGLHVPKLSNDRECSEDNFQLAFWCGSQLIVYSQRAGWQLVFEREGTEGDIAGACMNANFTKALVWHEKRGLHLIAIGKNDDPELVSDLSVTGAVFSSKQHILYWTRDRVLRDRDTATIAYRTGGLVLLSRDTHYLVYQCDETGDEIVYDTVDYGREILQLNRKVESDDSKGKSMGQDRLTDIVRLAGIEGYAACRRGTPGCGSTIELILSADATQAITISGAPYNSILLSPSPELLVAFGVDCASVWTIHINGEMKILARINIDRAFSLQFNRECIAISDEERKVALLWVRNDGRVCIANWRLPHI